MLTRLVVNRSVISRNFHASRSNKANGGGSLLDGIIII